MVQVRFVSLTANREDFTRSCPCPSLHHKPVKACSLDENSSDQRERVPVMVRQHRLVGGPAAGRSSRGGGR